MARQARAGLGLWDRLVLLVAWAVTCGLVYLLGFYVGRGTQEHRFGVEERTVRLPVTGAPPPAGQRAAVDNDLTFYDTLVSGHRTEERAEPAPASPPAAAPAAKPSAPAKPSALPQAASPVPAVAAAPATTPAPARPVAPATTLPSPRAAASPPPTLFPPRAAVLPPPPMPSRAAAAAPTAPPMPPRAAPPPATPTPVAPVEPVRAAAPPPTPAATGGWTVVADLTRNRDEADVLQRQLRGHGYDAAVVRVARDGDIWYRVRVGRFSSSAQAEEVRQRLREHEGVAHVFVASE